MKFVEIDICENCGRKGKFKGIRFICNCEFYHYVCKKCFKKLNKLAGDTLKKIKVEK